MGRGLSNLQKQILRLAYQNKIAQRKRQSRRKSEGAPSNPLDPMLRQLFAKALKEPIPEFAPMPIFEPAYKHYIKNRVHAHLYTYEVLVKVYGFELLPTAFDIDRESNTWNFDRKKIGEKKYASAHVAISKTFKRLEDRGLAVRIRPVFIDREKTSNSFWSGIDLTEDGFKLAQSLNG